jgi:hypothetical protein
MDGAGRACHGWRVLRLSDLTVFHVPLSFFIAANINTPFSEVRFFQTES